MYSVVEVACTVLWRLRVQCLTRWPGRCHMQGVPAGLDVATCMGSPLAWKSYSAGPCWDEDGLVVDSSR